MRLLVIEDEKKMARFLARGLKAERFAVDVAGDGEAGLRLAETCEYDLVILDLMLPVMSGSEVLRRLRQLKPELPILILTARDDTAEKVKSFEAGADDYLTKPFAFAELLVRIKARLRPGKVTRKEELAVADLQVDRLTQEVRRGGRKIALTDKEFALLEYLLANTGRVMSRTMIVEAVWDESFEGMTNIVDVYVRHLRRKIDDGQAVRLIHTVRGAGYTISEEQP
jgi:two-component system copper resistance phosphate regulon response regulator CusR